MTQRGVFFKSEFSESVFLVSFSLSSLTTTMVSFDLMELAKSNDIIVIEDCAQALGGSYKGQRLGSIGDFGCFSFHSQKNITTLGEGGMLTLKNQSHWEKLKTVRKIGAKPFSGDRKRYWIPAMSNIVQEYDDVVPYNFAMGEGQAIAGSILLRRVDQITETRKVQYDQFSKAFEGVKEITFQKVPSYCSSAFHLLPARLNLGDEGRNLFIEEMVNKYRIKTVIQYYPLYNYDLFVKNGYGDSVCASTNDFYDNMVSFPFWSGMDSESIDYLIESISSSLKTVKESL